jgi:hypothetical protein
MPPLDTAAINLLAHLLLTLVWVFVASRVLILLFRAWEVVDDWGWVQRADGALNYAAASIATDDRRFKPLRDAIQNAVFYIALALFLAAVLAMVIAYALGV